MTVDDVIARLLPKQRFVVIEGKHNAPIYNQLHRVTTIKDYEDKVLWRLIGKRIVHTLVIKDDVLCMYVEEMGNK
jgi:hypothetical protein